MKNKRIWLYLIALLVLIGAGLFGYQMAYGFTDNYAQYSDVKVQADDNQLIGILVIKEDAETDAYFEVGNIVTIYLPEGVSFSEDEQVIIIGSDGIETNIISSADSYFTFEITKIGDTIIGEDKISIEFLDVDIDNDVIGDIKVEIEAAGTTINDDLVTMARVVNENTTANIYGIETIPIDGIGEIGDIRIKENIAGILSVGGDNIELILPNGYEWDTIPVITTVNLDAGYVDGQGDNTLEIEIIEASVTGKPGFITINNASIITPYDAEEGEIEVTIKGNNVTEEDLVVARIGGFGFDVSIDEDDLETLIAGKEDQAIPAITINDVVYGSWIDGRTVRLELPSYAEFVDTDKGSINEDGDEIKYIVTGNEGKLKLEGIAINLDADAPAGDLVLTISGSAGVSDELIVGTVVAPFNVVGSNSILFTGKQNQSFGNITITESVDGALADDVFVVLEFPSGVILEDVPTIKVTTGNLEIEDIGIDGQYLGFKVKNDSSKVSAITISDLIFTVNNIAIQGNLQVKISTIAGIDNINDVEDNDEDLQRVTTVILGQITDIFAPGMNNVVQFTIGQYFYVKNGVIIPMDVAPYINNSRTYLPIRYVANAYGIIDQDIFWNGIDQTVILVKDSKVVQFKIGSKIMIVNGVSFTMDVAPEIIEPGRTMLPMRFLAQALGLTVTWDETTGTIIVK